MGLWWCLLKTPPVFAHLASQVSAVSVALFVAALVGDFCVVGAMCECLCGGECVRLWIWAKRLGRGAVS